MPWTPGGKVIDWAEEIQEVIAPALHFVGPYDAHIKYEYGDICIMEDICYIYTGSNNWEEISSTVSTQIWESPKLKYLHNCPNCGARMLSHKCEYCGTEDYGK